MGVRGALFGALSRGCAAAGVFLAGSVQRVALCGQDRLPLAHVAQRFATVAGCLSADAALD